MVPENVGDILGIADVGLESPLRISQKIMYPFRPQQLVSERRKPVKQSIAAVAARSARNSVIDGVDSCRPIQKQERLSKRNANGGMCRVCEE